MIEERLSAMYIVGPNILNDHVSTKILARLVPVGFYNISAVVVSDGVREQFKDVFQNITQDENCSLTPI